jgi:hypothetical protein
MSDNRALVPRSGVAPAHASASPTVEYNIPEFNYPMGNISNAYTFPSPVAGFANGSSNASGAVVRFDGSACVYMNVNSSTAYTAMTNTNNRALASPSYTFSTSSDQYANILAAQCDRVSNFIFGQLEQLDRSDEDQNDTIVDGISNVIGLVGEPAAYVAVLEAKLLRSDPTVLEPLLLAIATARHKETEAGRVQVLQNYASDTNYRVRRAAIRALGRMDSEAARNALKNISSRNQDGELGRLAAAMLR